MIAAPAASQTNDAVEKTGPDLALLDAGEKDLAAQRLNDVVASGDYDSRAR